MIKSDFILSIVAFLIVSGLIAKGLYGLLTF